KRQPLAVPHYRRRCPPGRMHRRGKRGDRPSPAIRSPFRGVPMGREMYVGNFSYDVSASDLQPMFQPPRTVQAAPGIQDRDPGRPRGFGFVEMGSDQEAQAAIAALNGQQMGGRALTVNEAKPREDRGGGGGGKRGGYGGSRRY